MKYISLTVFRLKDKKSLLTINHSAASSQMTQQAAEDFSELTKTFRKSALYEGMRESNYEIQDTFPPELSMELGNG